METDVNITHFPNVTNCKIDIEKIFSSEKMKPSSITEEEFQMKKKQNMMQQLIIGQVYIQLLILVK